jgi:glycosyltransferase involved in cell wall biosynthesis
MNPHDTVRPRIAVVIPCYRVRARILDVIQAIGPDVESIICVDDACPEGSGAFISENVHDPRVAVLRHEVNQGVGGATLTGYAHALSLQVDVVVKIDGDGQMDPKLIPLFVGPIVDGEADYTKGNRFTRPEDLKGMPRIRLIGNSVLSLMAKLSTGYWRLLDPTNGYTAIHAFALAALPRDRINKRYFFETDMLFHLRKLDACVIDVPMGAIYKGEKSNLKSLEVAPAFMARHAHNFFERIFYLYVVRDFNLATLELALGVPLFLFGLVFGLTKWSRSVAAGVTASAGSVMLSALPVLVGIQLILSFINYDMSNAPTRAISKMTRGLR